MNVEEVIVYEYVGKAVRFEILNLGGRGVV